MCGSEEHEPRPETHRFLFASGAIVVLAIANAILLEHRADLWKWVSGDPGVPQTSAIATWDRLRWAVGVLAFPLTALVLAGYSYAEVPLRTWSRIRLALFGVTLCALYLHLRWAYEWARETHIQVPAVLVRVLTITSLNAGIYVPVLAAFILVRWFMSRSTPRAE